MKKAKSAFESNPTAENEAAWKSKKKEFLKTPEGIKMLREKGENEVADKLARQRKDAVARYKATRKASYLEGGFQEDGEMIKIGWRPGGDAYLVENRLTEQYGWATDDPYGDEKPPSYLATEGTDPDTGKEAIVPSEIGVKSVGIYNTRTGERKTLWLVEDADVDGYSVAGTSYEEAEAYLEENVGPLYVAQN